MIPVTSFAGKTVAVFGLGGSGLACCHALKAGGAAVIAADDSADNVAKAAQAGFTTADLRTVSFERSKALELVVWLTQHRDRSTRTGAFPQREKSYQGSTMWVRSDPKISMATDSS